MDHTRFTRPLGVRAVRVTDAFWGTVQKTVREKVIPYQWEALNDRVPGAPPSYCIHNFRAAARRAAHAAGAPPAHTFRGFETLPEDPAHPDPDAFYGFVFQDTDLYKWIEAVAYALAQHPDPALERTADEAIGLVCAAQHENGYLDTYYLLNGPERAFTNLRDHHELYCLGHLAEAAAAYYEATGKDRLLRAACRFADYAAARLGPGPDQLPGYPGHEIAEMALARLYEVTGEEKYLALSKFFLDARGTKPHYFLREEEARAGRPLPEKDVASYAYWQAHRPVREQTEAVGHAVRAGYLYAGMADVARLTGDDALYAACERLWNSIVGEKLYITGGVGGTVHGEAFSRPFDLPNDSAYSETCAAIALVFFARRMLALCPRAKYADVMELALYNTVTAGMALDGESFFYVNPLAVEPDACRSDARLAHVKPVRQKWFGCACCPPNLARLAGEVAACAFGENETTLFTHLYIGAEINWRVDGAALRLVLESALPWEGSARMTVYTGAPVRCALAFRVPRWCGAPVFTAPPDKACARRDGYVYFSGVWHDGETVEVLLPMEIRLVCADARVREDIGQAAVLRGPLCYCVEEADNGGALHLLRIDAPHIGAARVRRTQIGGREMTALDLPGFRQRPRAENGPLYAPYAPPAEDAVTLRYIPYCAWANRGEGEMRVWLRV